MADPGSGGPVPLIAYICQSLCGTSWQNKRKLGRQLLFFLRGTPSSQTYIFVPGVSVAKAVFCFILQSPTRTWAASWESLRNWERHSMVMLLISQMTFSVNIMFVLQVSLRVKYMMCSLQWSNWFVAWVVSWVLCSITVDFLLFCFFCFWLLLFFLLPLGEIKMCIASFFMVFPALLQLRSGMGLVTIPRRTFQRRRQARYAAVLNSATDERIKI